MWLIFVSFSLYCVSALAEAQRPWETGFSDQYKSENTLGEYSFGYNEDHTSGGSFRRETSDRYGNKIGSYGLRIGDGRVRIVNYVADHNGFRADVVSNEPGVESQHLNQYSKITKKSIYGLLVPGFRYSPAVPYVSPDNHHRIPSVHEGLIAESVDQLQSEVDSYDEETYGSLVDQDGNTGNVFSHEDQNFGGFSTEEENGPGAFYDGEKERPEDSLLEGDYSHNSETTLQNETSNFPMMQQASEISSSTEKEVNDSTLTDVPALNFNFDEKAHLDQESKHQGGTSITEDLQSFQSSVILSKNKDIADHKNSTLEDVAINSSENSTVRSTTERAKEG